MMLRTWEEFEYQLKEKEIWSMYSVWRIIFVYDDEETRACGWKRNVKDVMLLSLFKARNILSPIYLSDALA